MEERGLGASVLHPLMEALAVQGWTASIDTRLPEEPTPEVLSASAVVIPVNHGFDERAKSLAKAAVKAGVQPVLLGRMMEGIAAIQVDGDQHGGGRLAAEFLMGQGHRQIALVAGIAGDPHSEARLAGFLSVAQRTAKVERWGHGDYTVAGAHRLVAAQLAKGSRPTAIFCVNDRMALGTLLALREAGLAVPRDVSLVGFDDQAEYANVAPGLSTIRLVADGVGAHLATLLEPATSPSTHRLLLTARLMVRGSTAAPRSSP
jgi:LacI family transcriptional regulator